MKSHSFITRLASLVCADCPGFPPFLHLPFAPIRDFSATLTPLQLTLTQAKQGSAIHGIPSAAVFASPRTPSYILIVILLYICTKSKSAHVNACELLLAMCLQF